METRMAQLRYKEVISVEDGSRFGFVGDLEVEGVNALSANLGSDLAELLGKKNLAKGIQVEMEEEKVKVELSILMEYGHTIPEVGKAVQDSVKNAVESMTGLEVAAVNVAVSGIAFEKKA